MLNRKGQSTLEYALIIAVVVAGLMLMMHYVKRGYAGRVKAASDDMGEQFDPVAYTGNFQITQTSNVRQSVTNRATNSYHMSDQVNLRTGGESVNAWTEDEDLYLR